MRENLDHTGKLPSMCILEDLRPCRNRILNPAQLLNMATGLKYYIFCSMSEYKVKESTPTPNSSSSI